MKRVGLSKYEIEKRAKDSKIMLPSQIKKKPEGEKSEGEKPEGEK